MMIMMKTLAIVSALLLVAGLGLAFGEAGSCICPNNTTCAQTGCVENCTGTCAIGDNATGSCAASCPVGNCGSKGGCGLGLQGCPAQCR